MRNVCRSVILVVALGTVLATAHQAAKPLLDQAPLWVDVKNHQLKDEYGRELYFHGTNIIVKGAPWIPDRRDWSWNFSFVAKDMQLMQDLGLNAIRLGAMWPGVEPQRGQYNMTYLDELFDLVQEASTYGIRSLLDMHQDLLSAKYCGDGIPPWAAMSNVTNFPWPLQSTPFNMTDDLPNPPSQCWKFGWSEFYPTQEVSQAFENLYQNGFGLRDAWAAFWQTVAKRFSSAGAAVLGYELLNEPWSGDVWKNPLLMVPGVADVENLAPAYEQLQSAIRAVDTQHPIFFEGVTWDWLGVGFQKVPGGDDFRNRSVLSYHFYIPPDFSVDVQFAARKKDMQRLGCGGMLTEFGSARCNGCGTLTRDAVMDKCDEDLQSWMFWEFKQFVPITGVSAPVYFENGTLNNAFAFKFSRTYAQVVAGTTQVMKFNITTADFDLSYTTDPSVTLRETVIYASTKYHYQGGYRLIITPDVPSSQLWYNVTGDYIRVYHSEALNNQTNIGIKIRAV